MANNAQGRKWALALNNPAYVGLDHEAITEILMKFSPIYFCMADEVSTTGTPHTHIFIYSNSPIRFDTIKGRFPIAHIEKAVGFCQQTGIISQNPANGANRIKRKHRCKAVFMSMGSCLPKKRKSAGNDKADTALYVIPAVLDASD